MIYFKSYNNCEEQTENENHALKIVLDGCGNH